MSNLVDLWNEIADIPTEDDELSVPTDAKLADLVIQRSELTPLRLFIRPRVDQTWTIRDIVEKCPPLEWQDAFDLAIHELRDVSSKLMADEKVLGTFFPLKADIFRAFDTTPLSRVKVVLIGMDPYPQLNPYTGKPRAQGLSFSVSRNDSIPASLQNIFKEIKANYPDFIHQGHGDLTSWAHQGVLLLNASLTVLPNRPGSHAGYWDGFLTRILGVLAEKVPDTCYVLWGQDAQKLERKIGGRAKILKAGHPSSRNLRDTFIGCGHFKQINEYLSAMGKAPICWNLYPR